MIPDSLKKELNIAVESALLFATKDIQPLDLAKRIMVSEYELIGKVKEYLVLDRLVSLITRKASGKIPSPQLELPGFESLPYRISIHGVRTVLVARAPVVSGQRGRRIAELRQPLFDTSDATRCVDAEFRYA